MQRRHRVWHRRLWLLLLIGLPLVLLMAAAFRQNGPVEAAAVLLRPPK